MSACVTTERILMFLEPSHSHSVEVLPFKKDLVVYRFASLFWYLVTRLMDISVFPFFN